MDEGSFGTAYSRPCIPGPHGRQQESDCADGRLWNAGKGLEISEGLRGSRSVVGCQIAEIG
jgi:hypothetical protein